MASAADPNPQETHMKTLVICAVVLLAVVAPPAAAEDDVLCLRGVKSALKDPDGRLTSWNFSNATVGFVCNFVGVTCWNPQENRVIQLSLPSMSLAGHIPADLRYCSSVQNLELSGNSLDGAIPSELCDWLPYLVTLDLSHNRLSGAIPADLSKCRFLNTLLLGGNNLDGSIPSSLSQLDRLNRLDLSGNLLTGPIPGAIGAKFDSSSFDSNSGLCDRPLSRCGGKKLTRTSLIIIIIAAGVFGAVASLVLAYAIWRFCLGGAAASPAKRLPVDRPTEDGMSWAERLRTAHNHLVPVSLFQKPIVKVKLVDLMTATADFHPKHIVAAGSSRIGTSYKAVIPDGSALTVKRLNSCTLSEKQFRNEMGRIGPLRHPNLVPLLGFCVVEDERLLVYKHMPNGALSVVLESSCDNTLEWTARLRIGIGTARGLAWLHHGFQIPFLHQNFCSKAVLLDEDFEARITDFGLTRLVRTASGNGSADTSPFMNGVFGEFGYVAPEYASTPIATTKGDVYAFGIILLELVTGQKPTEITSEAAGEGFKGSLVDWVNQLQRADKVADGIDVSLRDKGNDYEISQVVKIALQCVAAHPIERPHMYQVYESLKIIGQRHDSAEQFDEFPLNYGKDN